MPRLYRARSTALAISLFGTIINFVFTLNVLAAARAIRWEPDSEWEGHVDGVRLIWGILFAKFALSTAVCAIGFLGTLKNNVTLVRLYRDYFIADFAFTVALIPTILYTLLRRPSVRVTSCEALARQPELLRDLLELGLSVENCESWLERAAFGSSAALVVLLVCRLHLLLVVTKYYAALTVRSALPVYTPLGGSAAQRVFILPAHPSTASGAVVYAQIPLDSIPEGARARISEAWLAASPSPRRHHRRSSSITSNNETGRIALPVRSDEGLFPGTIKC